MDNWTAADADRARLDAIEADPLKPGMWRLGDRIGTYTEDWGAVNDRARVKFGGTANSDEAQRFARAMKVNEAKGTK